jgi:hypothetical protein
MKSMFRRLNLCMDEMVGHSIQKKKKINKTLNYVEGF